MAAPIIFDDTTDYANVELLIKELFSKRIAALCDNSCSFDKKLSEVTSYFTALEIDKETNEERYKNDVQSIYYLLTSKCC